MRFIVEEAVTGNILDRDAEILEPKFVRKLSGPAHLEFSVPYHGEPSTDINWKAYGQIVHVEEQYYDGTRHIIGSCLVQPGNETDASGSLKIVCEGFSSYAKGIPWIDNYNPIAVDPFAIVARIWNHLQTQTNGNLGVTITPASSGTLLLPGFGWDGSNLVINFFAIFVRAIDFRDCGDEVNYWARDIPFEYLEVSAWNGPKTAITKSLVLAYPRRGVQRNELAFILGENVIDASVMGEAEIDWTSDVIIRGWFPGTVYQGEFTNPDSTRFRRVMMQDDAQINTQERAAAAAKRLLTRNLIPSSWQKITIDRNHPNAPYGSFEVGDDILIQGFMPWKGVVKEWHRIVEYSISDADGSCEMTVKHVDAFNYDPISILDTTP